MKLLNKPLTVTNSVTKQGRTVTVLPNRRYDLSYGNIQNL